jgi:glycosyltransferase involved in cell wall biosynthesis
VGGRGIYKNFYPFLKAILPLFQIDKDLYIVCTGDKFSKDESLILDSYQISNRVIHIAAHDELLSVLYSKAIAFVFPSLYEGFGLPVLESFSCGCPVVLSNTSSLPEVGGDAVLYFDPLDASLMLEVVAEIVTNESLRKELTIKGYEQLKKFSWDTMANQTLALYKKVL